MSDLSKVGFGCIGFLALALVSVVIYGWALATMWVWFLVPLGLPAIGIWHAGGLATTVRLVTHLADTHKDERKQEEWYILAARSILGPLVFVGFGWLIWRAMAMFG